MYQVDIGQGDLTKTVYLYANDDNVFDEGDEVTTLTIDSVINGHVSSVSSSISSTIIDNDVRPDINLIIVSGDTLVEGSDSSATVRATLSEVTTRDVKISLGSSDIETDGFAGPNDFEIFDDSVVDESMALHLTFDGNTDDVSGNENNGVATNVALTTDRFGNENSAAQFIGYSDITIPISQSLAIEHNMTMSFWMLPIYIIK